MSGGGDTVTWRPRVPDTLAGRFALESEVGALSYGVLFAARELASGDEVAVTVLHPAYVDEPCRAANLAAIRLARGLDDPHIARILEVVEGDEGTFVVTEPAVGVPLARWRRDAGRMALDTAYRVVGQLLDVAERLHAASIHAALSSAHVRVHGGHVWVMNPWHLEPPPLIPAGDLPPIRAAWLAPEQLYDAAPVGPATDIYALGLNLGFLMACGLTEPGHSLLVQGIDVAPAVDEVYVRATARQAELRYPDIGALREALAAAAGAEWSGAQRTLAASLAVAAPHEVDEVVEADILEAVVVAPPAPPALPPDLLETIDRRPAEGVGGYVLSSPAPASSPVEAPAPVASHDGPDVAETTVEEEGISASEGAEEAALRLGASTDVESTVEEVALPAFPIEVVEGDELAFDLTAGEGEVAFAVPVHGAEGAGLGAPPPLPVEVDASPPTDSGARVAPPAVPPPLPPPAASTRRSPRPGPSARGAALSSPAPEPAPAAGAPGVDATPPGGPASSPAPAGGPGVLATPPRPVDEVEDTSERIALAAGGDGWVMDARTLSTAVLSGRPLEQVITRLEPEQEGVADGPRAATFDGLGTTEMVLASPLPVATSRAPAPPPSRRWGLWLTAAALLIAGGIVSWQLFGKGDGATVASQPGPVADPPIVVVDDGEAPAARPDDRDPLVAAAAPGAAVDGAHEPGLGADGEGGAGPPPSAEAGAPHAEDDHAALGAGETDSPDAVREGPGEPGEADASGAAGETAAGVAGGAPEGARSPDEAVGEGPPPGQAAALPSAEARSPDEAAGEGPPPGQEAAPPPEEVGEVEEVAAPTDDGSDGAPDDVEPLAASYEATNYRAMSCPDGMARVHRRFEVTLEDGSKADDYRVYCIDRHEFPGAGQMPRVNVDLEEARAACSARGKRLCNRTEWRFACGGRYPYGRTYDPAACNTVSDDGMPRSVVATGSNPACRSRWGVFDMVGNVAEWTSDGFVNGGDAYRHGESAMCTQASRRAGGNPYVGFRCCADAE